MLCFNTRKVYNWGSVSPIKCVNPRATNTGFVPSNTGGY